MQYFIWVLFIIILATLVYDKNNHRNYIYYACKKHKSQRTLLSFDQIIGLLETNLIKINAIDFDILKFYENFEDDVSEYIVNLLVLKTQIKEPFVKVKINSKIIQIIKNYEKCFSDYNNYAILLIQKIVDIMLETEIYIYDILTDFNAILNYESSWKESLQQYCITNEKNILDKNSILINLEITEYFYNSLKTTKVLFK